MSAEKSRVAIVDYGMGNLYSVERACAHVGLDAKITDDPMDVISAGGVILPGVGAMPDAMRTLDDRGLSDAIREVVRRGTPFFGVCLGMQLLMRDGSEFAPHRGLGIVEGRVVRFEGRGPDGSPLKVPHIGWNGVCRIAPDAPPAAERSISLLEGDATMYFVHSYYVIPDDDSVVTGITQYGPVRFCSTLTRGNVFACQFHPERSGPEGLRMYERFARYVTFPADTLPQPLVV